MFGVCIRSQHFFPHHDLCRNRLLHNCLRPIFPVCVYAFYAAGALNRPTARQIGKPISEPGREGKFRTILYSTFCPNV